jgi:uncharacterized SAM-binding protein YcdF (DUF218 family)
MRRFLLTFFVLLVAAYAVGAPLFHWRDDDPLPAKADAVVVLSGSDKRIPAARALVDGGIAPLLVVSAERNDRDKVRRRLCRSKAEDAMCVYPGPLSQVGDAQAIAKIAETRDWDTIILVTSRYSLFRSDRIFRRCADFRVVEYGVDEDWWRVAIDVPLEWLKLGVAETVRRNC